MCGMYVQFLNHKEGNDIICRKVGGPGDKHRFIKTPVWNPDDERWHEVEGRSYRVIREQKQGEETDGK